MADFENFTQIESMSDDSSDDELKEEYNKNDLDTYKNNETDNEDEYIDDDTETKQEFKLITNSVTNSVSNSITASSEYDNMPSSYEATEEKYNDNNSNANYSWNKFFKRHKWSILAMMILVGSVIVYKKN